MLPSEGGEVIERLVANVRGRVQGVGFRWFVQRAAQRLSVTGYVRNLADSRAVEVVAEGPRPQLQDLVATLRAGPPGSYVERVDESWGPATGAFAAFEIRH